MKLTLNDALTVTSLKEATVLTNDKSTLNKIQISNIIIMEGHDIERWLDPNEIVLTSLIGYQDSNETEFIELFKKLKKFHCSGLIIKLGRFLTKIPENLKKTALEINLPLIIVDNNIQYKDIQYQITQLLFNESNRQLELYRNTNQIFIELMEKTTQVSSLIAKLSSILNNPIEIVDSIKYESRKNLLNESNRVTNEYIKNVPKNKLFSRKYVIHEFSLNKQKRTEILTRLYTRNGENKFLCVKLNNNNIEQDQFISIDVATSFIDLQLNIESNIKNINKVKINDSIDALFTETHSETTDLPSILTDHGFIKEKPIKLIYCEINDISSENIFSFFYDHPSIVNSFIINSKNFWSHLIYRTWPNRLLLMIQSDESIEQIKRELNQIGNYTVKYLPKTSKIRISIIETDYKNLKYGSEDCLKTLNLSSIIFGNKKPFITTKDDLGIYQLLAHTNDKNQIQSLIPQSLLLLNKQEPELIETLDQYISNLGNLSKSADALFIHPKTMSYRIKKLEDKYHLRLDNANELTNIAIGIHLLKIL